MTLTANSIRCLAVLALALQTATAQELIPPPGVPQSGYYIEFSDETTLPGNAPQGAAPTAWPSNTASFPVASSTHVPVSAMTACDTGEQLWAGACDDSGVCDAACDSPCMGECGLWAHCSSIYASAIYLRPRNADVAYAVPIDGPISAAPSNAPLQIGQVGVVDPDYDVGFAAGINLAINPMTSLFAQFMMLDSSTSNQISTAAPNVMRSLVSHPSSVSAATDFLHASADLGLQLDTLDLGLRHLFVGGQVYAVNYFVGARYSRLEQTFAATFIDNGREDVATDIDFDGAGLSLGLEAERQSCTSRLRIYSRGAASFLAGKFQGSYFQGQSFDPTVVEAAWEAGRVVPVLDLELGAGWTSPGGCLRLQAGYLVSAWFNTVTTEDFIHAVQANDFVNLGDSLTFDGLRAEVEWRF